MDTNVEEKLTGAEGAIVACILALATVLGWVIATLSYLTSPHFVSTEAKRNWNSRKDFRQHSPDQPIDKSGILIAVVILGLILWYAWGRF